MRRVPRDGDAPRVSGRRSQLPRQSLPFLRRLLRRLPVLAAARVRRQRAARAGAGAQRVLRGLCVAARARADVRAQRAGDQHRGGAERRGVHSRLCGVARRERDLRHAYRAGRVLQTDAAQRDGAGCSGSCSSTRSSRSRWACAPSGAISAIRCGSSRARCGRRSATPAPCAISMAAASAATITTSGRTTAASSIITSPSTASRSASRRPAWRRSITICSRARRRIRGGTCRWCSAPSAASGSSSGRSG